MKKRQFLKTATTLATGSVLIDFAGCKPKPNPRTNWAGNLIYGTANVGSPKSSQVAIEIIKNQDKLRVLGTKHCFNSIADSNIYQLSSENANQIIEFDKEKGTITVGGGIKYGELCKFLDENGFALPNLASLPHISIAGACATATHGSGIGNGCLATAVIAIEIINGKGEIVHFRKDTNLEEFNSAVVALGCLGFVSWVTLQLIPTFKMRQVVYQNMPMKALEHNFENIMSAGYSVSLFTDWLNGNVSEVWIKSKTEDLQKPAAEFFGAKLATKNLHPIESLDAVNCTEQLGKEGPWYERMPHFRMGFTPSSGKELQAEYFIPFENAFEGFMAVESLKNKIAPHLMITEIRSIAADEYWMSPFFKKRCLAIHFTWKQETEEVLAVLPEIENALAAFGVRPHWGKLFTIEPKLLQSRIEKLSDFKALVAKHDPEGKFQNEFIKHNLYS